MSDDVSLQKVNKELEAYFAEKYVLTEDEVKGIINIPYLKMLKSNSENLPEGLKFDEGDFYHSVTEKLYKQPEIAILCTLATRLPGKDDESDLRRTDIMGGFILEDQTPFVSFWKGLSLSPYWNGSGEAKRIAKRFKKPLYAIVCKMTNTRRDSQDGKYKNILVPSLEVVKNKEGQVKLVTDFELLKLMENGLKTTKDSILEFVQTKEGVVEGQEVAVVDSLPKPERDVETAKVPENLPFDK